jgi:hypothetical protein
MVEMMVAEVGVMRVRRNVRIQTLLYTSQLCGCVGSAQPRYHCRAIATCSRLRSPRFGGGRVHDRCHEAVCALGAAECLRSLTMVGLQPVIS